MFNGPNINMLEMHKNSQIPAYAFEVSNVLVPSRSLRGCLVHSVYAGFPRHTDDNFIDTGGESGEVVEGSNPRRLTLFGRDNFPLATGNVIEKIELDPNSSVVGLMKSHIFWAKAFPAITLAYGF